MSRVQESPKITSQEWGAVQVEGAAVMRDAKLFPGGCREWDWRETGTRHVPGVQFADVEELLLAGAEVVVLSLGVDLRLCVPEETILMIERAGVVVYTAPTPEAVRRYNQLRETVAAGALIHSTC